MKPVVFYIVAIAFLPIIGSAQTFKPDLDMTSSFKDEPAYLLDTVADSRLTKNQLYSNGLNFISRSFQDSRSVIELKDADLGEIHFKGWVEINYIDTVTTESRKKVNHELVSEKGQLHFKCRIYVKDGRYKIVLSDLETTWSPLFPDIRFTLSMNGDEPYNVEAKQESIALIRSITEHLDRVPENDF